MSFVSFIFMPAFPLGRVAVAGYTDFRSGRFGLSRFGLGRSGLGTFRSGHEILQKSYMFTF